MEEGFALDENLRPRLHEALGRELPTAIYEGYPPGHRCVVAPEPTSEKFGLLYKARSTMDREQLEMGAGWIVAVGPRFGAPGAPHPVGMVCSDPREALGRHVYFRSFSGVNLKTTLEDTEFGGQWSLIILTDRDILFTDYEL